MRNDVARKMGGKHARADHLRDSGHSYHWPWRLFWAPSSRSRDGAPEIGHGLTLLPCRTSLPRAGMSLAWGFFAAALTCRRVHDETPSQGQGRGSKSLKPRCATVVSAHSLAPKPAPPTSNLQFQFESASQQLEPRSDRPNMFRAKSGLAVSLPFVLRLSDSAIRLDVNMRIHLGSSPRDR